MGTKKIVGICIVMLVLCVTAFTVTGTKNNNGKVIPYQTPNSWSKTYGGERIDWGNCIQQTSDGGYIISGTYGRNVWSLWYCYFYLLKIDALGNEEWYKTQGTYDRENVAQSIRQTSDGGYIITGYSGIPQNMDLYLEKTDSNGNIVWARTFGKPDYCFDLGRSVEQTLDGGYIITGETGSYGEGSQNVWLIKIDENGIEQWNKTFGGDGYDAGNCVKITSDGGYIILGFTDSFNPDGTTDVWLIKTDSNGNEEWNKTFGGSDVDEGRSIQKTLDNGYIITGYTYSYGVGGGDVWLIKTDIQGNEEWNKTFGGSDYDEGWCVQQTNDNGFFITGDYGWGSQQPDVYTIKTDSKGNEEWNHILDKNDAEDVGYYGIQTSDGGYIVSGYTGFFLEEDVDVLVIKFGEENQPPTAPSINGTKHGKVGTKYSYKFTATDPDGDNVYYVVNWGSCCDDTYTYGPFTSGEEATINHTWTEKGTFIINAKTIDTSGAESDLTTLEVIMPKTISYKSLFLKLLERFPNAFPILRYFLGL